MKPLKFSVQDDHTKTESQAGKGFWKRNDREIFDRVRPSSAASSFS